MVLELTCLTTIAVQAMLCTMLLMIALFYATVSSKPQHLVHTCLILIVIITTIAVQAMLRTQLLGVL